MSIWSSRIWFVVVFSAHASMWIFKNGRVETECQNYKENFKRKRRDKPKVLPSVKLTIRIHANHLQIIEKSSENNRMLQLNCTQRGGLARDHIPSWFYIVPHRWQWVGHPVPFRRPRTSDSVSSPQGRDAARPLLATRPRPSHRQLCASSSSRNIHLELQIMD